MKISPDLEGWILAVQSSNPLLRAFMCVMVYTIVAALPAPILIPLSLLVGWMLGFWIGMVCVSFSSVLGATLTFLSSRYLLRHAFINRFRTQVSRIDRELNGGWFMYLVFLRLCPGLPFFVVNASLGLTSLSVTRFWLGSQLGMLPAIALLVGTGSQFPGLKELLHDPSSSMSPKMIATLAVAAALFFMLTLFIRRYQMKCRRSEMDSNRTAISVESISMEGSREADK